jgi:hypothetical protein
MASVDTGGDSGGGKKGKKRAKRMSTHIDMTPMVDLAFLLLTFFILTTTMSKPTTMQLTFPVDPKDKEDKPMKVPNAITMILTKGDVILYYRGELSDSTTFQKTDYKAVRKLLIETNRWAFDEINKLNIDFNKKVGNDKEKAKAMEEDYKKKKQEIMKNNLAVFCIIKPDKEFATYRNMIDLVDEMDISGIGKYAVSDKFADAEIGYLTEFNK